MPDQQVPLDTRPNQSFQITLAVDAGSVTLNCYLYFNEMAQCWVIDIFNLNGDPVLLSTPLLTGIWPAANLLCQQGYLQIGSAFILNLVNIPTDQDYPDNRNLGTEYIMIWSDTAP